VIEDESGSARVHPGAPIDAVTEEAESAAVDRGDPDAVRVLGALRERWLGTTALLWTQHRITVGERVTIYGRAEFESVDSARGAQLGGDYREAPRRLVLEPVDGAVVVAGEAASSSRSWLRSRRT
jgi:hypothetical protein